VKNYIHQHSWKDGLYLLIPAIVIALWNVLFTGSFESILNFTAFTSSGMIVMLLSFWYWNKVALKLGIDSDKLIIHYDDPMIGGYWKLHFSEIQSIQLGKRTWFFRWFLSPYKWGDNVYLWMRGAHKVTITTNGITKKVVFVLDDLQMANDFVLEIEARMGTRASAILTS